jgi:hypothetical protein
MKTKRLVVANPARLELSQQLRMIRFTLFVEIGIIEISRPFLIFDIFE